MTNRTTRAGAANTVTRRSFLTAAAAGGASVLSAPAILRGRNLNEKLNIAVIGSGGRGAANMRGVESENIVALCDVSEKNLNFAAQRHPNAPGFIEQEFELLFF